MITSPSSLRTPHLGGDTGGGGLGVVGSDAPGFGVVGPCTSGVVFGVDGGD